jgi:hypothetical protein
MPSPRGTNHANAYLVRQQPVARSRRAMALDQATKSADLIDPKDDSRRRLLDLVSRRLDGGTDEEVAELLERLDGHGAVGEQERGPSQRGDEHEDDERITKLARFLRSKGLGEDDVKRACDAVRLGIGESTKFGGALSGNFAGNLHSEVDQPSADRHMIYEEQAGCTPFAGRDSKMGGRDQRITFDEAYGLVPVLEAARPHRRRSENALAMDSTRAENFLKRFPSAARIKPTY